jgi:uncharacterized protein with von Willebrand factor type A (vWA) domain
MGREDLMKMLDLDAGHKAGTADDGLGLTSDAVEAKPLPSETALSLDNWGIRRGEDLITGESNEKLKASLAKLGDDEAARAAADFHGAAYEIDPKLNDACTDPLRHEFIKGLLETPECQALRTSTVLNDVTSEIAATAFAAQFAALRAKREERAEESAKKPEKAPKTALDRKRADEKCKADAARDEIEVLAGVGKALAEASKDVEEAKEAASAMGMGPGAPGSNDPKAIAALYLRIRNNPRLKRICELAGKFRRVAQSKQRQKTTHGMDDVVGVEINGDLGRALPHELAKLAMPEFEDDVLRRFVEHQVMCREYAAAEPVAKGPIIVSVDESGSMEGDKGHTAKAIALAMAWVARHQKRWCGLIAYSGDSGHRMIALPPGRWNEGAVMDWLDAFIGRGSSMDVPVREMPEFYRSIGAPDGKTDVVFITDAICSIPADLQAKFNDWKTSVKAQLTTLVVRSEPGDLRAISDEVFCVDSLDVSEAGVDKVLSV